MNDVFQTLLEKFKEFAEDSLDLISGYGIIIFPDVTLSTTSDVFKQLLSVPDEESKEALKQCLE